VGLYFFQKAVLLHEHRLQWFKNILHRTGVQPDALAIAKLDPAIVQQLKISMAELKLEQGRLYRLLDFKNSMSDANRYATSAKVIGRSPSGWRDSIVLDRGADKGLREGMLVMTPSGLVGKVVKVTPSTALARLITDPRFKAGGLIQRTRFTGVVYGTIDGEIRMKYLPMDGDIRPGDIVLTAGLTAGFPKGVPIGVISDVWREHGRVYKVAEIKPFSDSNRIEEVLCVLR
ncbi:MAG: rod shape-determining protein MreC, partial [Candidatus Omnitrophota bacterium]